MTVYYCDGRSVYINLNLVVPLPRQQGMLIRLHKFYQELCTLENPPRGRPSTSIEDEKRLEENSYRTDFSIWRRCLYIIFIICFVFKRYNRLVNSNKMYILEVFNNIRRPFSIFFTKQLIEFLIGFYKSFFSLLS